MSEHRLSEALVALAKDREEAADRLAEIVLDEGDVPDAPTAESGLLEMAAARVKSAIAEDEASQLLRDCKDSEERIVEAATLLLGYELPEEIRQRISSLRTDASSRLARLQLNHQSSQSS